MSQKFFIPLILGTNRKGRQSEKVTNFLLAEMKKREDIEVELIDLKDLHFPYDDAGPDLQEMFPEFISTMKRASAVVLVTPEYNRSFPGILKMALDLLEPTEAGGKPIGIASVSSGQFGGARVIVSLLPVLRAVGFITISGDLMFPFIEKAFKEDGTPVDEKYYERATKFLDEVVSYIK